MKIMNECQHEWVRPYKHLSNKEPKLYRYLKCLKCGIEAIEYKCNVCGEYTPHIYKTYLGKAKKIATDISHVGELESWVCLKCGNSKTIRKGGSFKRMG